MKSARFHSLITEVSTMSNKSEIEKKNKVSMTLRNRPETVRNIQLVPPPTKGFQFSGSHFKLLIEGKEQIYIANA